MINTYKKNLLWVFICFLGIQFPNQESQTHNSQNSSKINPHNFKRKISSSSCIRQRTMKPLSQLGSTLRQFLWCYWLLVNFFTLRIFVFSIAVSFVTFLYCCISCLVFRLLEVTPLLGVFCCCHVI